MIASTIICTVASAILYRLGGAKGFDTKYRDVGCPIVFLAWFTSTHPVHGIEYLFYLPIFGLMWGALTTYWDWLFGFDNYWFHGFMIGMSTLFLFWVGIAWWMILGYSLLLAILMGGWCSIWKNDILEEMGRGAFIIIAAALFIK